MTQLYFHCSNSRNVFVDRRGAVVNDLVEALDHATRVVQSLTGTGNLEDWRDWVLHASDDLAEAQRIAVQQGSQLVERRVTADRERLARAS